MGLAKANDPTIKQRGCCCLQFRACRRRLRTSRMPLGVNYGVKTSYDKRRRRSYDSLLVPFNIFKLLIRALHSKGKHGISRSGAVYSKSSIRSARCSTFIFTIKVHLLPKRSNLEQPYSSRLWELIKLIWLKSSLYHSKKASGWSLLFNQRLISKNQRSLVRNLGFSFGKESSRSPLCRYLCSFFFFFLAVVWVEGFDCAQLFFKGKCALECLRMVFSCQFLFSWQIPPPSCLRLVAGDS